MEDINEPLARYRDEFAEAFARHNAATFERLTRESEVDIQGNRAQIAKIAAQQKQIAKLGRKHSFFVVLLVLAAIATVLFIAFAFREGTTGQRILSGIGALVFLVATLTLIKPCRNLSRKIKENRLLLKGYQDEAWRQMAPLNALYAWGLPGKLFEDVVPNIHFDPYFSEGRLEELRQEFGWDDSFNDNKSILYYQSGQIIGNPFVLFEYLEMEWGSKTYTGQRVVTWTTYETGGDGKRHAVSHSQTLTASVSKPVPVYSRRKCLLYGNDAAPDLSFTRYPSELSGAGKGLVANWKKKRVIHDLKKFSENLTDDSDYTLMSNHEFEALFDTRNRDNEIEYRMLFTPLAQRQMLLLLKDKTIGFGDDFTFVKRRKINIIAAEHLNDTDLDPSPARFRSISYDEARKNFLQFNRAFFKSVYFAFAPLLAIPLYQQTKTHKEIYKDILPNPSFWEYEYLANAVGENAFKHPASVTDNILKISAISEEADPVVEVTAQGYRGVEQVDHQQVLCNNGRLYDVSIPWVQYVPVEHTTRVRHSELQRQ